jgi:hypothetical protein
MLGNEYEKLMAAEAQLREAYLCELGAMVLVVTIGLVWLAWLIAALWREARNLEQLKGEKLMQRSMSAAKRYGLLPKDDTQ